MYEIICIYNFGQTEILIKHIFHYCSGVTETTVPLIFLYVFEHIGQMITSCLILGQNKKRYGLYADSRA